MTDVRNWSDPPAEFALHGSFTTGARGTTNMPGRPPVHWTIDTVDPGRAYTLRTSLSDGASMFFHWQFESLGENKTRLTQRLELCGADAAGYVNDIRAAFESNLEPGMRRIAGMMMVRAAQHP
jgi:polyketide cyclase/dehydrase/lipid transport protein